MKRKKWKMPAWMEPYRELVGNTGGNKIEELMNYTTSNMGNNFIRTGLIIAVISQVELLERLHEQGKV